MEPHLSAMTFDWDEFKTMSMVMGKSQDMDTLELVFGLEGDDGPTGEMVRLEVTILDQSQFVPVAYALLAICPKSVTSL